MVGRFLGERGRRLRVDALASQKIVAGNRELAEELADRVEISSIPAGETLIAQGSHDNSIYFVLSGNFDVVVNGRRIAGRGPNEHVGEMAAVQPAQRRSANVVAAEQAVVARLTEELFTDLGNRYPQIFRYVAQELASRLLQRNALVGTLREEIRIFIICSTEDLPIASAIQNAFASDPFTTIVWTDGVFRATNYPLEILEARVDDSDFAVAIAHADDLTPNRGKTWPGPRDNVIFELGLFVGRLGRSRAILMEPRLEEVKLPSDFAGVTTITYRFENGADVAAQLAPACNQLRKHINALGPNNG
jgi:predicted nucleotide-binding protein